MAEYKVVDSEQLDNDLASVADTIRENGGASSELSFPEDFNEAIGKIYPTEEVNEQSDLIEQIKSTLAEKTAESLVPAKEEQEKTLNVTENGTFDILPDSGKVLSKATVNVEIPIPEGYVKPSGTLNIIENGTQDVTEYALVNVDVPIGGADNGEEIAGLLGNTLETLDNSIVTSLRTRACQGATALVSANLPSVTSLGGYAFYQATGLETVKLPKLTTVSTQVFYGCTKLEHADCGMLGNLPAQTFNACSALTELILRKSSSICTLSNVNAINNTPIGKGTGYVYVPSALVDSYKENATWSTFAEQFRAIEDYPEICGGGV